MPPKRKARKGQTQTQRQSVVVNIGTKRKSSGRGRLPPPSQQHNLAPTFITTPQIDYTNLFASLLHTTAKVQDPVPIRNPVTPLSATTQSAQQMAGAAALNRVAVAVAERRPGPTSDNFQPLPSEADERLAAETQDEDDVTSKEELRLKTQERLRRVQVREPDAYVTEQLQKSGGSPIATAVAEVTSIGTPTPTKKQRKPRATKAEMESRAEQASDPRQSTMVPFLTPRLATPTGQSVSRSPKAISLQNMVSAFRQGQAGQGASGGGLPRNESETRQAFYLQQQQQTLDSLKNMGL